MANKKWADLTEAEKEDQRARNRKHYAKYAERMRVRRANAHAALADFVDGFKKRCARCGLTDKRVLDFHHVGGKDKAVSVLRKGYSRERIYAEISKCVVLCANCHRVTHWEELHESS